MKVHAAQSARLMLDKLSTRSVIRFLPFLKPQMRLIAGAVLMGVGKFTLPLAFPLALKYVIDVLLAANSRFDPLSLRIDRLCASLPHLAGWAATRQAKLSSLSIILLLLYLLQSFASYFRNYWGGIAGMRLVIGLQQNLYAHLQRLPNSYFDRNPTGSIVSRVLDDVARADGLLSAALIDVWMDATSLALVIYALFAMDRRLAAVALCVAPIWVFSIYHFSPKIKLVSRSIQEAIEELSGEIHERVSAATTIKSFSGEEKEIALFKDRTDNLCVRIASRIKLSASNEMCVQLLTRGAPIVVVWSGAMMIMSGSMTLGTLLAFTTYLGFVYLPLERLAQISATFFASSAAIERVFEFLDLQPEITDHALSRPFAIRHGSIRFENVRFTYPCLPGDITREVLRGIDLEVQPGTRVALVGRSGAGKSTLANLIPRFYDVTSGRVLIDGHDVRHFTLKSLRGNIAIVSQDALLFSMSLRANLTYAREDASDKMMFDALEQANLHDFVRELPYGLDTIIGERGVKMSVGQRQRLALARAFVKNSKILILDEATSAVDSESENLIHEAMERLMEGRTVFLIAHRLRSATNADLIVALDHGRVVETGTHAELLRRHKTYAHLYHEQARGLALPTVTDYSQFMNTFPTENLAR